MEQMELTREKAEKIYVLALHFAITSCDLTNVTRAGVPMDQKQMERIAKASKAQEKMRKGLRAALGLDTKNAL